MRRRKWQGFTEALESRVLLTTMAEALSLNSLAGANHTIYLDFDGHTTVGTSWNTTYNNREAIVSAGVGYSADQIVRMWSRVAEDFAPFNVNVTTQEPPVEDLKRTIGGDTRWGIRAVVTADQSWLSDNVGFNVGGIAYTTSFNFNTDTPVFVFNTGEITCAETISHEVGHSLGLSHDGVAGSVYYYGHGSGPTGWAPIMGAGFGRELSQWSKGEYPNATLVQDDLSIITTNNGFGYRVETIDSIELLFNTPNQGIITTRNDTDGFYFTVGAGTVTIDVKGAQYGSNLDIYASLRTAAGEIIVDSNPIDQLNAYINTHLEAGTYVLHIDGVGKAANGADYGYSDYGSLGQYTVSATFVADPIRVPVSVKLDLGTTTSSVADGYKKLTSTDYYNATRGYGWIVGLGLKGYDQTGGTDLSNDFVSVVNGAMRVDVVNGTYKIKMTFRDTQFDHDMFMIVVNGVSEGFWSVKKGETKTYTVERAVTNGSLTIIVFNLSQYYVPVAGIEVEEVLPVAPPVTVQPVTILNQTQPVAIVAEEPQLVTTADEEDEFWSTFEEVDLGCQYVPEVELDFPYLGDEEYALV